MAFVTLDFETFYGVKYSLSSLSYEEYIFHPQFKVHGVGIKIDNGPTIYYDEKQTAAALQALFYPGNPHTLICHNTLFDGPILSWYYKLRANRYWCTKKMSDAIFPQYSSSLEQLAIRLWPDDLSMRKGKELASFKDVVTLTPEQQAVMGGYCRQDVDLTFAAALELHKLFPPEEIEAIEWTLEQFIHPVLEVDTVLLEDFLITHEKERAALIEGSGTTETILSSNIKFAAWLEETHGLTIPKILSPTAKDPENMKLPLSKQDKEFINIQLDHPELDHVWKARMEATSSIAKTRAERMIRHSTLQPSKKLAIPLKYYGAHTGRWSGCNKINVQNLQAGSPHRLSLLAPAGYMIAVSDLANIEGRVLAWFAKQTDKCKLFAEGVDLYNRIASEIYGRPIDRKRKEIDPDTGDVVFPDATEGFVGKTLELGLGYRMGANKLRHSFLVGGRSANRLFFSEEECQKFVRVYRALNDRIAASWLEADAMIFHMTQKNEPVRQWRCLEVGYRYIKLPNGMFLTYPQLRAIEDQRGGFSYVYWQGKYDTKIHGGKLIENIIQALSRIIMNDGRRRTSEFLATKKDPDVRVVMTVHDELVAVVPAETADSDWYTMSTLMCDLPSWADDGLLHLETAGGYDVKYSK